MALAISTLQAIRDKFRQLTRTPNTTQITDDEIDQYINTFIESDMPQHLRLFDLHSTFTFYLSPNVDTYPITNIPSTSPLFNFSNNYTNVEQPVYIGGYLGMYTQEPNVVWQQFPMTMNVSSIGVTGNGVTTNFSGYINTQATTSGNPQTLNRPAPILQSVVTNPRLPNGTFITGTGIPQQYNFGRFIINSVDTYNNPLSMVDYPIPGPYAALPYSIAAGTIPGINVITSTPAGLTTNGNWGILVNPTTGPSSWDGVSFINYITGQFTVSFQDNFGIPTAPQSGATINAQFYPYIPSRPKIMLFYNDMFIFRPVPDQAYPVTFNVYSKPTQLLSSDQVPNIAQWWQYICYGAARKRLQDQNDRETLEDINPEFQEQELLVLRKTIVQSKNQRTNTIYITTNGMWGYGPGYTNNGF